MYRYRCYLRAYMINATREPQSAFTRDSFAAISRSKNSACSALLFFRSTKKAKRRKERPDRPKRK